jgi:hypothetical protein
MKRTSKEFEWDRILFNESYVVFLQYKTLHEGEQETSEQSSVNRRVQRADVVPSLQSVVKELSHPAPTRIYSLQALCSILNVAVIYDTVDL